MNRPLMGKDRQTIGRYTRVSDASLPAECLPKQGKINGNVEIKHGTVVDPNPENTRRQRAAFNTKHDFLEQEYARARITEGAYRAGRVIEAALQWMRVSGQAQWNQGDRVDGGQLVNDNIARGIDRARQASELMARVRSAVGGHDEKLLRMILGDGMKMEEVISRFGGPVTDRTLHYQSKRFRDALEYLSEKWAAVG